NTLFLGNFMDAWAADAHPTGETDENRSYRIRGPSPGRNGMMHIDTAACTMPSSSTLPLANIEASLLQLLAELDQIDNEHQLMQAVLDAVTQMIPCRQAFLYEWDDEAGQPQLCYSAATQPGFLTEYLARFRSID